MKNCLNKYLQKTFIVCVILLTGALVGCGDDHKDHGHNKMNKLPRRIVCNVLLSVHLFQAQSINYIECSRITNAI